MSTAYRTLKKIKFDELFDGRLEELGVREELVTGLTDDDSRCLIDGQYHLWVYRNSDGNICGLRRSAGNHPERILSAIAEAFDIDIVSEYEPRFWGYETRREWELDEEKGEAKKEAKFYLEILKFVLGKPNNILTGPFGWVEAQIAIKLVAENPDLLMPEHKTALLNAVEERYPAEQWFSLLFPDVELARDKMAISEEDDIPF